MPPWEVESPASVRIVASRPLLRAGLERLAAGANVSVLDNAGPVDMVLRAADEPADASPIDVTSSTEPSSSPAGPLPSRRSGALGRLVASALSD